MKLFNFRQKGPVTFEGNGILLRESKICFSLTLIEEQINKQFLRDVIPTNLSIRNLAWSDFLFFYKNIHKNERYIVLKETLTYDRSYTAVYDQNGHFLCACFNFRFAKYLFDIATENPDNISWIDYQWTLDNQGNHLLQIDYLGREKKTQSPNLVLREFVSVKDQNIVRRKISYADSTMHEIETHLYDQDCQWTPTSDQDFPAEYWKQISNIFSQYR